MLAHELKAKYLQFFKERGHKILPNLPLVPENDPTTLFISAGMQPLTPYLLGEPHPQGARLASLQRCLRTTDIDEVGDVSHLSFFEMLGNWSLGDPASPDGIGAAGYFKEEALSWSLEFVTQILNIPKEKLSVTIFKGDELAPFDEESQKIWLKLGIPARRIFALPRKDNWWEGGGENAPGGPDSEIFVDTGQTSCGPNCHPGDNCPRFFEIWNNVFMVYQKKKGEGYNPLPQKNVDTGLGVERTVAILQGQKDNYETELFIPIITEIEEVFGKSHQDEINKKAFRVITDHLRAAVFLLGDGIIPSNVEQGYVLRRLIRRAIRFGHELGERGYFTTQVAEKIVESYEADYPHLLTQKDLILQELEREEETFGKTLARGLKEFEKLIKHLSAPKIISGEKAFKLYESYGFPIEQTVELAQERNLKVDLEGFKKAKKDHQELSRAATAQKFASGLMDHSKEVIKLHTATHLLHQALRDVLRGKVAQKGSNITNERLRFDFSYPQKLTEAQIKKIEQIVNEKIKQALPVSCQEMSLDEAVKLGALAFFGEKYGERVRVYSIGPSQNLGQAYSKEVCSGPHVDNTAELGHFRIVKEESVGKGTRRIKAVLK